MSADALRTELLGVAGVAAAEVDRATDGSPAGVKVQLAPGADARRVGAEVQRILAAQGMRSRFADEDAQDEQAAPTPPQIEPPIAPPPVAPLPPSPIEDEAPPVPDAVAEPPPVEPPSMTVVPMPPQAAPPIASPRLQSVALEERIDGLTAVVSLANGRQGSRAFGFADADLDEAVVAAFAEAAGRSIEVLSVEWFEVDSESIVTVVLRREDGLLTAGAGVIRSGRAFAVAAAARAALDV